MTTSRPAAVAVSGPVASSVSCATAATSSTRGSTTAKSSGSCTFLLSDGQRFRCPLRFQRGPTSVSLIEHSKACVQLARLVIPAALRAVAARIGSARTCLTAHGLSVTGGLVLAAPPNTPERAYSPDGELDTSDSLIGFYGDRGQAQRLEPAVVKNAKRFSGQVERDGAENIVWVASPPRRLREIVQTCTPG